jgi:hypothetical protein
MTWTNCVFFRLQYIKLYHDHFLLHPFRLIKSPYNSMVCNLWYWQWYRLEKLKNSWCTLPILQAVALCFLNVKPRCIPTQSLNFLQRIRKMRICFHSSTRKLICQLTFMPNLRLYILGYVFSITIWFEPFSLYFFLGGGISLTAFNFFYTVITTANPNLKVLAAVRKLTFILDL